jgi:serine/threonine protein kinase
MDRELTSTGTILGSPFYMSPEHAEALAVGGRTDIYSLGIIFYELLTGMRPYNGDTAIKVIMQHIQPPVPKLVGELEPYQSLLNHMMAKKHDERLPDAAALLRELRVVRGDTKGDGYGTAGGRAGQGGAAGTRSANWSTKKRLSTLGSCLMMVAAAMGVFYGYAKTLQNAAIMQRNRRAPIRSFARQ